MSTTATENYIINLNEAETKAYRTNSFRRENLQSEAEQQANSRQCDVYLMASDGKNLFRAWPRANHSRVSDVVPSPENVSQSEIERLRTINAQLVTALRTMRHTFNRHTCNGGGSNCLSCAALDVADVALNVAEVMVCSACGMPADCDIHGDCETDHKPARASAYSKNGD